MTEQQNSSHNIPVDILLQSTECWIENFSLAVSAYLARLSQANYPPLTFKTPRA